MAPKQLEKLVVSAGLADRFSAQLYSGKSGAKPAGKPMPGRKRFERKQGTAGSHAQDSKSTKRKGTAAKDAKVGRTKNSKTRKNSPKRS